MLVEQVKKLSPLDRFLYWIRERHNIYLQRLAGWPKPWTDDEILQSYFFTNPYRENDKTTVWFRENLRNPLRKNIEVIFATIAFRWFNRIKTGAELIRNGWLTKWNGKAVLERFKGEKQVFTGAFMINSPAGVPKLEAIVDRITKVWKDRGRIHEVFRANPSMESAHNCLTAYEGLGGFMAYEIVCDLRYTKWVGNPDPVDVMTWCNPGPGCIRGLYRIAEEDWDTKGNNASSPPKPKDWLDRMKELLRVVRGKLFDMPLFEMREIEHSLCEFDKYERALWGDGKLKRRYKGE